MTIPSLVMTYVKSLSDIQMVFTDDWKLDFWNTSKYLFK